MLRFYYVIFACIFLIIYFVPVMAYYARHPEKYTELECYKLAQRVVNHVKRKGRISTRVFGMEDLPEEGGYIMYANHQGKYDALGIIAAHEKPCTVVIDSVTAKQFVTKQFIELLHGKRFVKGDLKQQAVEIISIIKEVKQGRKYLIFPEAGYKDNKNDLQEFHAGSFKMALKAQCPIIPVALYDSYKAFFGMSLKQVRTQVHFLKPIQFEEYKDMNTAEISALVKKRIEQKLMEVAQQSENTNAVKEAAPADTLTRHRFLGLYDYSVVLVYMSLCFGIFGSFMAINGNVPSAVTCLVISALFSAYDNKVSRTAGSRSDEEKSYGGMLYSFGNLLSFGVLPCIIGYANGLDSIIHILFFMFYIVTVVVRLAYFNVKGEEKQNETVNGRKKYSIGLPVLTIAFLIPVLYLLKGIFGNAYELILTCVYPFAGILYISRFRMRRPVGLEKNLTASEEEIDAQNSQR